MSRETRVGGYDDSSRERESIEVRKALVAFILEITMPSPVSMIAWLPISSRCQVHSYRWCLCRLGLFGVLGLGPIVPDGLGYRQVS